MNTGQQQTNGEVHGQSARPGFAREPEPAAGPKNDRRQQGEFIPISEGPIERLRPTHVPVGDRGRKINLRAEEKSEQRRNEKNDGGLPAPDLLAVAPDRGVEKGRVLHQAGFWRKVRLWSNTG